MNNNKTILGLCENINESMEAFIPYNQIQEEEFDIILNKLGAFLYLINNKNINPTHLFLMILSEIPIQKLSMEMMCTPTIMPILKGVLNRYPSLIKSKMLKSKASKINKTLKKKNINVY